MYKRTTALLLASCLVNSFVPLQASTAININTSYYKVDGTDAGTIRKNLDWHGPSGKNGKKFHASTRWDIQWSYNWMQHRDTCSLTDYSVSIDVDYLLPQLATPEKINQQYLERWNVYYEALFRHEQHHKDMGVQAAQELDKFLSSITTLDCSNFQHELENQAEIIVEKYKQLEIDYDIQTNHGLNEGIKIP